MGDKHDAGRVRGTAAAFRSGDVAAAATCRCHDVGRVQIVRGGHA